MAKTLILIVLWATVLWRSPSIRRSPKSRSLWLTLACLALALTFDEPFVIRELDRVTGVTDLATPVKHVLGVASCANLLDWIVASVEPEREPWYVRRRRSIAALTALGLIVLFVQTPRVETVDFAASAAGNAWAVAYLLVFELYLAFAMALACRMFFTAWRDTRSRFLRIGVALLVTGTAGGVVYAAARSTILVLSLITGSMPDGSQAATSFTDAMQAVAIALILLGLAVPACEVGWRRARTVQALIYLRPLWLELTRAVPSVTLLDPSTLREDLTDPRASFRLVRRVTEIRDASLYLRRHVPERQWQLIQQRLAEAGMTGSEKDAAAEACWIGAAIRTHAWELPQSDVAHIPSPGGFNLDQDLKWLRAVAKARRTVLVAEIEAQIARINPTSAPLRRTVA